LVEAIEARFTVGLMGQRHSANKTNLPARVDAHSITVASGYALAFPYRHQRGVALRIHIEAVISRFENCEGGVGSVYFVDLAIVEARNLQIQRALVKLQLHGTVGKVRESKAGLAVQAHRRAAKMQFGT